MFNVKKNNLIVSPKVDLIRFSIDKWNNSGESLNNFFNKLNSITKHKTKPLKEPKQGYNHSRIYTIVIHNKEYKAILSEAMYESYLPYLFTIHDPDRAVVPVLNQHLSLLDFYNVNAVEYAFDFTFNNKVAVYNFIKSTALLAWRGKPLNLGYTTTHYLNNNWTAYSKAGKVYRKMISDKDGIQEEITRLEITFKRRLLRKRNIKKCSDIFNIKMNDVYKYISFKVFNYNLFTNKLINLSYDRHFIENLTGLFKQDIYNGFLHETNNTAKTYCMNKNYLKEHPFNKYFRSNLTGVSFWDQKHILLDSGMMGM